MHRFTGMTPAVADFLTSRVFCLPSFSMSPSPPVTAREFADWVKDLPAHFSVLPASPLGIATPKPLGHKRVPSTSSAPFGHPISSCPPSRRPSSRAGLRTPVLHTKSLAVSRAPSVSASVVGRVLGALETVVDVGDTSLDESEVVLHDLTYPLQHIDAGINAEIDETEPSKEGNHELLEDGRSRSNKKRGRRGARKSKAPTTVDGDRDETLHVLAIASQSLAREISHASRSSSLATPAIVESTSTASPSPPPVVKKASIWKLPFSKGGCNTTTPIDELAPGTANNVSSLIMGLDATPTSVPASASSTYASSSHMSSLASLTSASCSSLQSHYHQQSTAPSHPSPYTRTPLTPQRSPADEATTWARGRRPQSQTRPYNSHTWGPSLTNHGGYGGQPVPGSPPNARGGSPQSVRSGLNSYGANGVLASSASSITSSSGKSNWRSSVSSTASASTSGFTRYSNSSTRSVNTMATSVSSGSWRSPGSSGSCTKQNGASTKGPAEGPPGIKSKYSLLQLTRQQANTILSVVVMCGVPKELVQLPRQLYPNPEGDIYGQQRKRTRKPKDLKLDTISERPPGSTISSPHQKLHATGLGVVHQRQDAATSTTDLDGIGRGSDGVELGASTANANDGATPRKVQKGQIHALAKMLSAFKR